MCVCVLTDLYSVFFSFFLFSTLLAAIKMTTINLSVHVDTSACHCRSLYFIIRTKWPPLCFI